MQDTPAQDLAQALLAFARAPGRHALRQREPAVLFEQLDTLAQWALGRLPAELASRSDLRNAAVLFVQRACLVPGNTHYQVLGLEARGLSPARLRTRYRALIRLTHPDMGVQGLPADAAGMVNRAHEVLADVERRNAYDRQLAAQLPPVATPPRPMGPSVPVAEPMRPIEVRSGWRARWTGLHARHPKTVRLWLGGGLVAALASVMVGWGAHDSAADRRLVIGAGRSTPGNEQEPPPIRLRVPVQWETGVEVPRAVVSSATPTVADVPAAELRPQTRNSTLAPGSDSRGPAIRATPPTALATAQPLSSPVAGNAAVAARALPVQETAANPVRTTHAQASSPFSAPLSAPLSVASNGAAAPAPTPAPTLAQAAPPQKSGTLDNTRSKTAPDADTPEGPTEWEVDTTRARHYLVELLNELEEPARALKTSRYLAHMNVRGTLLQPQLQGGAQAQGLRLERVHLNESRQTGLLRIRGVVLVQLESPGAAAPRQTKLRLSAEFRGTPEGTVLTQLDMKETD